MRRTAGTRLARHAVPLATVSAIMGHSDVRLTQRYYVRLAIEDTKKAVEGVPEVGAAARVLPDDGTRRRPSTGERL